MGFFIIMAFVIMAPAIQMATANYTDIIPVDGFPATSDIIKFRGFEAIDHYVTTTDGYILNLVEMRNPLILGGYVTSKPPIFFCHGIANAPSFFLVNSVQTSPKNFADLNVNLIKEEELLNSDPSTKSLPFLASNFGHRIFLLARRGSSGSLQHINPDKQPFGNPITNIPETLVDGSLPLARREKRDANSTSNAILKFIKGLFSAKNSDAKHSQSDFNPSYWNFSLDEQAKYDIPEVIGYILKETKKEKLAFVGHSVGSALILMSLSQYPELANSISRAILFGPALYPTSARDILASVSTRLGLTSYVGPILPKSLLITILNFVESVCSNIISRPTVCIPFLDSFFGSAAKQMDLSLKFFRISTDLDSSHSFGSLVQAATKGKMHFFDYMDPIKNRIAYGQDSPPIYDVSKIKLNTISLWSGGTDGLVPYRTALEIGNDMSVPVEQVHLSEPGLQFDHFSYSIHKNISRLVNIPALRKINS